jgi:hypothetical protein
MQTEAEKFKNSFLSNTPTTTHELELLQHHYNHSVTIYERRKQKTLGLGHYTFTDGSKLVITLPKTGYKVRLLK